MARHVVLQGRAIAYALRQGGGRRRLTLTVDERGLRVSAPRSAAADEIEGFIRAHGAWVIDKLDQLAAADRPRQLAIRDGIVLPLLGTDATVRVQPGRNRVRWIGQTLLLEAAPRADLNLLARRALQRQALEHFSRRLAALAPLLALEAPRLALNAARTRWGSCSRQSGIRLNWRMIHLAPHLGDYVAVHELAHLHEMNHGPRFWAHVESACPSWRAARDELKAASRTIPLI